MFLTTSKTLWHDINQYKESTSAKQLQSYDCFAARTQTVATTINRKVIGLQLRTNGMPMTACCASRNRTLRDYYKIKQSGASASPVLILL